MGGIDLTNQRFGKLLVIGRDMETEGIKSRELRWICKCEYFSFKRFRIFSTS